MTRVTLAVCSVAGWLGSWVGGWVVGSVDVLDYALRSSAPFSRASTDLLAHPWPSTHPLPPRRPTEVVLDEAAAACLTRVRAPWTLGHIDWGAKGPRCGGARSSNG